MKKIRLLLMLLVSMLAIGVHAQSYEDWMENAKDGIRHINGFLNFGDYINTSKSFVYYQGFSYAQGIDIERLNFHPLRDTRAIKLNRDVKTKVSADFLGATNPDTINIPRKQRPELDMDFTSVLNTYYKKMLIFASYGTAVNEFYKYTRTAVIERHADVTIDRGGVYNLKVFKDQNVIDHQLELTVEADPEIRVDVLSEDKKGFALNAKNVKFIVSIASGYPYKDRLADYQGKEMKVQVFDADNKKQDEATIKLQASNDSTFMEYVATEKFTLTEVISPKYTFKISGPLLKDGKELVITKDVQPYFYELKTAISSADSLCYLMKNDPSMAYHAFRAEMLQEASDKAKECLSLSYKEQSKIDETATSLGKLALSTIEALQKKIVYVNSADSLIKVIAADACAQIQLTSNIDISGVTDRISQWFGGSINGSKNPSLPNSSSYAIIGGYQRPELGSIENKSLFGNTENAYFSNITFKNIYVKYDSSEKGMIAARADYCKYHNIRMENVKVECTGDRVGTIAGDAAYCVFDNIYISNTVVTSGHSEAGSLAGLTMNCTIRNCYNDSRVGIFTARINMHVDGLNLGSGGFSGKSCNNCFQNCENHALVAGYHDFTGGISGHSENSQFLDCKNAGTVMPLLDLSEFYDVYQKGIGHINNFGNAEGGICGRAENSSFERCSNNGKINGVPGGIVGYAYNTNINNCLNEWDCGIVHTIDNGKISNCLNLKDRSFVQEIKNLDSKSANNYSLLDPGSTRKAASYEMGVTEEQLRSRIVARWLNNGIENLKEGIEPWRQNKAKTMTDNDFDSHPVLDPSHRVVTLDDLSCTYIYYPEDLIKFVDQVNAGDQFACARLCKDLDFTGYDFNWTPIGKDEDYRHFRGIFDGQGHTINIECTSEGDKPIGLFGSVHANAEIRNVIIGDKSKFISKSDKKDDETGGTAGAGGIVGNVHIGWTWGNVVIENCGSYAEIHVNKHGGGILGRVKTEHADDNVKVFVNNCFNMGKIIAYAGNSAQLCGYMKHTGVVSNCWSGGELRSYHDSNGYWALPYSTVNPKKEGEYFAGYDNRLDIKNCYIINPGPNMEAYNIGVYHYPMQDGVGTIYDDDLSRGQMTYFLNGKTNDRTKSLVWQQNIGTDEYPEYGSKGVYHTRDVSNEYGTVCLPYAVKSGGNTLYYPLHEFKDNNGEMEMKFVYTTNVIPAGTPVLYRVGRTGENAFYGAAGVANGWADDPGEQYIRRWMMYGTYKEKVFEGDDAEYIYYVSNGTIKNATNSATVPPYRAYFVRPTDGDNQNSSSEARIRIVIEDENGETTAIQLINDELAPSFNNDQAPSFGNGKTYSLMGTEVGKGYRGIVIRNGKKILVK